MCREENQSIAIELNSNASTQLQDLSRHFRLYNNVPAGAVIEMSQSHAYDTNPYHHESHARTCLSMFDAFVARVLPRHLESFGRESLHSIKFATARHLSRLTILATTTNRTRTTQPTQRDTDQTRRGPIPRRPRLLVEPQNPPPGLLEVRPSIQKRLLVA